MITITQSGRNRLTKGRETSLPYYVHRKLFRKRSTPGAANPDPPGDEQRGSEAGFDGEQLLDQHPLIHPRPVNTHRFNSCFLLNPHYCCILSSIISLLFCEVPDSDLMFTLFLTLNTELQSKSSRTRR